MKRYCLTMVFLLLAANAWADPVSLIEVEGAALSNDGASLELRLIDRDAVQNACDYHVARFEYVEAASLLIVDLKAPTPCNLDRFGRRKGRLTWDLPSALRGSGRLSVIVNQVKLGELVISGKEIR
jgi:hypothetical protein